MEEKSTLTSYQYFSPKSRQHLRSMSDDLDNKTSTLFMSSDSYRPENISILLGRNRARQTHLEVKCGTPDSSPGCVRCTRLRAAILLLHGEL